jgi:hypothetical protein
MRGALTGNLANRYKLKGRRQVHRLAYANHYLYISIVQSLIVICQLEGLSINETPSASLRSISPRRGPSTIQSLGHWKFPGWSSQDFVDTGLLNQSNLYEEMGNRTERQEIAAWRSPRAPNTTTMTGCLPPRSTARRISRSPKTTSCAAEWQYSMATPSGVRSGPWRVRLGDSARPR